ncbi:MAG: trypsin-like peptidase domain-containing protein, partial [Sulfuricaulis sp.]|uniref:trypsin-like peptidase domain-containing protein n=1 Tax=Sulfuricaulis sp. TaxID=2003553 RepID=UPI003C5699F9
MDDKTVMDRKVTLTGGEDLGGGGRGGEAVAPADAELLDAYSRAVIHVVERVGPAVVNIRVGHATGAHPLPSHSRLGAEEPSAPVRREKGPPDLSQFPPHPPSRGRGNEYGGKGNNNFGEPHGAGSGVVIAPDGYLLTNHHVVQGAAHLSVTFTDGAAVAAEVVGSDAPTDLAVLR